MKKKILLAGVLSALTLPAMADGFYLLGDIGQSKLEYGAWRDGSPLDESDTTYSFGAGFDLSQFAAIEISYRDFGSGQDVDHGTDNFNEEVQWADTLSVTAFQASIVGKLPVNEVVNVYGRLGFANLDVEEVISDDTGAPDDIYSDSKAKALFGVGASFNIAPEFAVRAEYNQYAKWGDLKLSAFTVGATYHF